MIDRIGPRRPAKLYIEEWMATIPGMDRKRLAERMECAQGTISKKLSKPELIDAIWLERFRAALNLPSVADLFRHPNAPTPDDLLRGLTEAQKNEVINFVGFLRQKASN